MNNHRTEPKSLTIILSNRAPVQIETARWPVIASANRTFDDRVWSLEVRRHEDCRTIVYGQEYLAGPSDPDYSGSQAGELVPAGDPIEEQDHLIAREIIEVGNLWALPIPSYSSASPVWRPRSSTKMERFLLDLGPRWSEGLLEQQFRFAALVNEGDEFG